MQITLLSHGSTGDVVPMISLALTLRQRGHQVHLAAPSNFQEMVESYDLAFTSTGVDTQEAICSFGNQTLGEMLRNRSQFMRDRNERMVTVARNTTAVVASSDLVVYEFPASAVATFHHLQHGVRLVLATMCPIHPTGAFPPSTIPLRTSLGSWSNRLQYSLLRLIARRVLLPELELLLDRLGDSAVRPPLGELIDPARHPTLGLWSPSVASAPTDWPDTVEVVGYPFLDHPPGWSPPKDLVAFLDDGPPPVFLGFGSMYARDAREQSTMMIGVLRRLGQRVVVATGWGGLEAVEDDPAVHVIKSAPHDWLFPRVSVAIHHCGCGTSHAALRAGIPSVPLPSPILDQPFWANRMWKIGVATKPVMRNLIRPGTLERNLRRALEDTEMQQRAREVAAEISLDEGAERAAKFLEAIPVDAIAEARA